MSRKRSRNPKVVSLERGLEALVRNSLAQTIIEGGADMSRGAARSFATKHIRRMVRALRTQGPAQTDRAALEVLRTHADSMERDEAERIRQLVRGLRPIMAQQHQLDDLVAYWIADRAMEGAAPLSRGELHAALDDYLGALIRLSVAHDIHLVRGLTEMPKEMVDAGVSEHIRSLRALMLEAMPQEGEAPRSTLAIQHAVRSWRRQTGGGFKFPFELLVIARYDRAASFAFVTVVGGPTPPARIMSHIRLALWRAEEGIRVRVRALARLVLPAL